MIMLPKKDANGKPYISYSQYTAWKDAKSFNLGTKGMFEYMLSYFLGVDFGDRGWAEFGADVEDYICTKEGADKFTKAERATMDTIVPLGRFQQEFSIDFGDFNMIGFIDDLDEKLTHIRDYKTCSKNSSAKYYKEDYYQLDVYSLYVLQETGKLPEKLEVCMIERKGNCMFKGGREVLKVGAEVWYHERQTDMERLEWLKADIMRVAEEISNHYKAYLKLIGHGTEK